MNLRACVVLLFSVALCCTGCIEQSVVIKVDEDGSAIVHLRSYAEKSSVGFGESKETTKRRLPSEAMIRAMAAEIGEGVRLKERRESTNSSGWKGFEVIFECDDINQVDLDLNSLFQMQLESQGSGTASSKDSPMSTHLRFKQDGKALTIINDYSRQDDVAQSETTNPFEKAEPLPTMNPLGVSIATSIVKRARVGVFVQVEGGIQSTTAKHHSGNLITLNRIDGSEMEEKTIVELLTLGQGKPAPDRLQSLADQSTGIDWDLQREIVVTR
ncbi:MAG: hypothetical protein AAFU85_30850 [Planctomycetota bacterium]